MRARRLGSVVLVVVYALVSVRTGLAAEVGVPIVFVSRVLPADPGEAERERAIEFAASGRLVVRETSGELRVLVDAVAPDAPPDAPIDVMDPDVSYDASRIVFAGYSAEEAAWRLFEVGADGTGFRQVTFGDPDRDLSRYGVAAPLLEGFDDLDPVYLPDGRIGFVSTRYPGIAPDNRRRTTNLYVVDADGGNLHRITTERFGADTPTVDPASGRIVYSRWWRSAQTQVNPITEEPEPIPPGSPEYGDFEFDESEFVLRGIEEEDFPGLNSWFLAGIDSDGTDLVMHSGFRLDRELTQAYRPSFLEDGSALALFLPQTPFYGYPRGYGLRRFERGPSMPEALGGPQRFPDPETVAQFTFLYASAVGLSDGRVLVSAAPKASGDYGIYVQQNAPGEPELVHDVPGAADLDAVPLVERELPASIEDVAEDTLLEFAPRSVEVAFAEGGRFTFLAENIFFNAPVDVPVANAPPAGKRLTIQFFMSPQRTSPFAGDAPLLIREVEIPPSGRVQVELPGGVPLFEVLRRPDGSIPLGRDGQIFHVGGSNFGRAGETNRCVGCHAGHSQLDVPEEPAWTNVAPSALVRASSTLIFPAAGPGIPEPEEPFPALRLVDRSTERRTSEWAAGERSASIDLRWSTTLRARELVLYGPRPGGADPGARTQAIGGAHVTTFLDREPQYALAIDESIAADGTRVALDPETDIDRVVVSVAAEDVTGLFEGMEVVALSEIEVIAKASGEPRISFLRGDAGCDGNLNLTDSIVILNHLFLGGAGFCCDAAADVNDDGLTNITDAIFGLNFLFLGGAIIPPPFPCGPSRVGDVACDVEVCFF